ncbi:MAG: ECF transporter S component [Anaerostipes sp.]|nr:ECF transporter S component [Anaerostipes sp.]MDD5968751.1 ECF transporter S component [Anaerostipes sp.]
MEEMTNRKEKKINVRTITMTGLFGALSAVLMMFSFNVPLMPSFIKMDFSELPALIAAFSMGPLSGVMVCLVKNLINLMFSTTGGVGELSNFILGCAFVMPAGLVYKKNKNKKSAFVGALLGAVIMAVFSVFSNYFVVYPVYTMFMPMEAILGMYQAIYSGIDNLLEALIIFNMPFTFIKGMCSVLITFVIYKHISPIIKGTNKY